MFINFLLHKNLLVSEDGIVKIADFGISKMIHASGQKLADAAGTPAFMSPELCAGQVGSYLFILFIFFYICLAYTVLHFQFDTSAPPSSPPTPTPPSI